MTLFEGRNQRPGREQRGFNMLMESGIIFFSWLISSMHMYNRGFWWRALHLWPGTSHFLFGRRGLGMEKFPCNKSVVKHPSCFLYESILLCFSPGLICSQVNQPIFLLILFQLNSLIFFTDSFVSAFFFFCYSNTEI